MKNISILDDEYLDLESLVGTALQNTKNKLDIIASRYKNKTIDCTHTELKYTPEYVNIKAELNPIVKVNETIKVADEILGKKLGYCTLQDAADMNAIYNYLIFNKSNWSVNDGQSTMIRVIDSIFGGYDAVEFNVETNIIILNALGEAKFKRAVGNIKEFAMTTMSNLDSKIAQEGTEGFLKWCQKLEMLGIFNATLKAALNK